MSYMRNLWRDAFEHGVCDKNAHTLMQRCRAMRDPTRALRVKLRLALYRYQSMFFVGFANTGRKGGRDEEREGL